MFTGIVETTAKIIDCSPHRITVERPERFDDVKLGSSISVGGVCLTIVALTADTMMFDVVDETLAKTTFGNLKPNDRVNLERAMRADGRLDGHVVQGHVEGVSEVISISQAEAVGSLLTIKLPSSLLPFAIPKGSIAIDGVSLTIASVKEDHITIALIPQTLQETTLGKLIEGDTVNIETDILLRAARQQK